MGARSLRRLQPGDRLRPGRTLAEFRYCYGFLDLGQLAPLAKTTSGPSGQSNEYPGQDQVPGDLTALTGGAVTKTKGNTDHAGQFVTTWLPSSQ
jgi:hypothetical protein